MKHVGGALRDVKRRPARKGLLLRYGAYVDMPENELTLFAPSDEAEAPVASTSSPLPRCSR